MSRDAGLKWLPVPGVIRLVLTDQRVRRDAYTDIAEAHRSVNRHPGQISSAAALVIRQSP